MNNTLASMTQLAAQSPILLIYCVGLGLAVLQWRRSPLPSLLTLIALALLLLISVVQVVVTQSLVQARTDADWSADRMGHVLMFVGVVASCLRAIGFGLLIAAVFVKRGPVAPSASVPAS
jgi:hypothetical protein